MVARCSEYGLDACARNLGVSGNILGPAGHYSPELAAQDLAVVKRNIEVAGAVGIRTLTWDFTALRSSEGYGALLGGGRGGADLRDFDSSRLGTAALAPLGPRPCSHAEMWERLHRALEVMVPAAEKAGVVLALHPTDPPVPMFRGVAQILVNFAECQRLVGLVDSPANCFFLDTGVATEWGEDAVEVIEWFGSRQRIGMVHFRNCISSPIAAGEGSSGGAGSQQQHQHQHRFVETFIDDGACDMWHCMAALQRNGYLGGLDPDHTPRMLGDTPDTTVGWSLALGYMAALRDVAAGSRSRAGRRRTAQSLARYKL